jgi:hypothetical protein
MNDQFQNTFQPNKIGYTSTSGAGTSPPTTNESRLSSIVPRNQYSDDIDDDRTNTSLQSVIQAADNSNIFTSKEFGILHVFGTIVNITTGKYS